MSTVGGPTAEELDRKAERIVASGTPAYYLGDNPRGNDLEDIYRNGDSGAHGVTVGYDFHCQGDVGCTLDISVDTLSISTEYLRGRECERLDPVLGVPAVRLDNGKLTLFTGHSMISLEDNESDYALRGNWTWRRCCEPLATLARVPRSQRRGPQFGAPSRSCAGPCRNAR